MSYKIEGCTGCGKCENFSACPSGAFFTCAPRLYMLNAEICEEDCISCGACLREIGCEHIKEDQEAARPDTQAQQSQRRCSYVVCGEFNLIPLKQAKVMLIGVPDSETVLNRWLAMGIIAEEEEET